MHPSLAACPLACAVPFQAQQMTRPPAAAPPETLLCRPQMTHPAVSLAPPSAACMQSCKSSHPYNSMRGSGYVHAIWQRRTYNLSTSPLARRPGLNLALHPSQVSATHACIPNIIPPLLDNVSKLLVFCTLAVEGCCMVRIEPKSQISCSAFDLSGI